MNWYWEVLKKYAVFKGRAGRMEFWMFSLIDLIITILFAIFDGLIGLKINSFEIDILTIVYALILLLPSIAVSVRRLHDIGKNGWLLFIVFIPLAGLIWLLVLCAQEGMPGENEYGLNPKEKAGLS